MKNFSLTITGILTIALSLVIEDIEMVNSLVADLVTIGGILIAWYGRYRQGDISVIGMK